MNIVWSAGPCCSPRGSEEPLKHTHKRGRERRDAGGQPGPGEDEGLLSCGCRI